jgi:H+/Cl- antiporter ClcA
MSGPLVTMGILLLAVVVFGHIVHQFMPEVPFLEIFDDFQNTLYLLLAAGAAFAGSVLVRVLSPMKKVVSRNKCRKCGAPIPPKELYCLSCVKQLQARRR